MKWYSCHSFIFPVILAGFIIFFTSCSGCVDYSSPPETATPSMNTLPQIPVQTPGVTPAATPPLSPFPPEPSTGTLSQGTGSLIIWTSPPACSVYIDGMYVGDTPAGPDSFTTSGTSGPHIVTITKIGYEDYTQSVVISGGRSGTVTATLSEKTFPYYTLNPTSTFTESMY
jgi:hypothetical protein